MSKYELGKIYEFGGAKVGDPPGPRHYYRDLRIGEFTCWLRDDCVVGHVQYSLRSERYGEPIITGKSWEEVAEAVVKMHDDAIREMVDAAKTGKSLFSVMLPDLNLKEIK